MAFKKPVIKPQYDPELSNDYTEAGSDTGAKLDISSVENPDVLAFFHATEEMGRFELKPWVEQHADSVNPTTVILDTDDGHSLEQYRDRHPQFFYQHRKLNLIRHLDTFLACANEELPMGGYLMCHARTAMVKKKTILEEHPPVLNKIIYAGFYIWHRVCPRVGLTKGLYFAITKGKNRTYHRVEVLGRMYRAGFEVINEGFRYGEFFVLARKVKDPIKDVPPSVGPFVKLWRVSKGTQLIGVYKFRTMYPYSEYLQPYIYEYEGLRDGGKFLDDYRVNGWGRFMRSTWLDELPMIINLLKGQIKLVGVRPLSKHYFSLYTSEMQNLRIKVKPGLIPPFYYEKQTPVTLDEVMDSERRYIEAYLKHPFLTDCRYFWGSLYNILIRRKRSH